MSDHESMTEAGEFRFRRVLPVVRCCHTRFGLHGRPFALA